MLENTEDKLKIRTIQKLNTNHKKQTSQNKTTLARRWGWLILKTIPSPLGSYGWNYTFKETMLVLGQAKW